MTPGTTYEVGDIVLRNGSPRLWKVVAAPTVPDGLVQVMPLDDRDGDPPITVKGDDLAHFPAPSQPVQYDDFGLVNFLLVIALIVSVTLVLWLGGKVVGLG